jgi:nitrous oxide reductase accessory protein NosL
MKKILLTITILIFVHGCSPIEVKPEAKSIELVNTSPDKNKCKFLGEIVGSQGNWLTGDLTSNKNLVIGARNELRNEASKLGANIVYVQDMKNTNAWRSMGTTNTTAIGKAYKCSE